MYKASSDFKKGIILCFFSYLMWGLFPLYWKQLSFINPSLLLAHRVSWSFVFLVIIVVFGKQIQIKKILFNTKNILWLALTSLLIGTNWFVYIYAINNNQIVDASFGYYINPLVNIALGVFILKEKLSFHQRIAIIFAIIGVCVMSYQIGRIPVISLILALTFSLYGLFRKIINLDSISALTIETLLLFPIAIWWIYQQPNNYISENNILSSILLMLSGVFTALPLLIFGRATSLIPLSTIGFMQYLSPSLQLAIGIFIYHEKFTPIHILSFGIVWIGLAIYTWSLFSKMKKKSRR